MIFGSSGAGAAWELLRVGESLYVGCQGEAARCGKFWRMIFEPQGGYRSASFVLAAELYFATLIRGTAVVAAPLPKGRYGPGGQRVAGKPIGEIHSALREPTLPSRRGTVGRVVRLRRYFGRRDEICCWGGLYRRL